LIDAEGEQAGVVSLQAALAAAEEAGLDLVEIAPLAQPPVCRVMDLGKFKYQEAKKAHDAKQKQKQVQVKEVKLRPGTDENDYQIKLRNLKRFLEEGDKAKVTLRFRAWPSGRSPPWCSAGSGPRRRGAFSSRPPSRAS
jgi:translation initiation factor IF-3